jgi:hypothetical protein
VAPLVVQLTPRQVTLPLRIVALPLCGVVFTLHSRQPSLRVVAISLHRVLFGNQLRGKLLRLVPFAQGHGPLPQRLIAITNGNIALSLQALQALVPLIRLCAHRVGCVDRTAYLVLLVEEDEEDVVVVE